ncbi:MAG: SET domain-containing protein [Candidatus Paceibacteria bacterium]
MVRAKRGLSGLGLFAQVDIPRDEFVIEYWGKTVPDEEADRVGGKYLFRLENDITILGNHKENLARLMNHSCRPNCEAEMDGKRIFIYSKRNIKAGDELTYDYGKEYFNDHIKPYGCRCPKCSEQ